jgi:uncharacterized caspase-like protein
MAISGRQALSIGNDAYFEKPLGACVNDATDIYNSLSSIGFQIRCATDLPFNDMRALTHQFVQSIRPGSIVMFYFSGHGLQYNGINYLIPINNKNISLDSLDTSTLNIQELIDMMHRKGPRLMLIILDCCREYNTEKISDKRRFFSRASISIKAGLAPMRAPLATVIAYACAADEFSSPESRNGRNSLYTYHLLRHIGTPNIDIDLVFRNVAKDVQRDPLNVLKQTPFRYNSCNEIICLVNNRGKNVRMLPGNLHAGPVFRKSFYRSSKHAHSRNTFRTIQKPTETTTPCWLFPSPYQQLATSIQHSE